MHYLQLLVKSFILLRPRWGFIGVSLVNGLFEQQTATEMPTASTCGLSVGVSRLKTLLVFFTS